MASIWISKIVTVNHLTPWRSQAVPDEILEKQKLYISSEPYNQPCIIILFLVDLTSRIWTYSQQSIAKLTGRDKNFFSHCFPNFAGMQVN